MIPNLDLVFSYWLFAWFLIYIWGGTPYNPKIWLQIGVAENLLLFFTLLYFRTPVFILVLFLAINACIKLLPLWILRNTEVQYADVFAGLALGFAYLCWVYLRLGSLDALQQHIHKSWQNMKDGKPSTPLVEYILLNSKTKK
jgi:hypothetical protein